jgi:hypothetical protein
VHVNPHYALGATRVVGRTSRHHGWANPGNREEPALGSERTDGARLVACHRPQGKAWHVEKRKEVEASVPTRIREIGFGCPHVEVQLQKSVGDVWSQISSASRSKKSGQSRVNGGLARGEGRRVKPSAGTSSERNVVSRPHRLKTGEDRRKAQGDERSSSSGRNIAKSGAAVAGPGL